MAMHSVSSEGSSARPGYRFPAEVRFSNAREVLEAALPELDAVEPRFDLSACERFDSSLVAVLLELSRRALALQRQCSFVAPGANLRKLTGLYGVEGLLFDDASPPDLRAVPAIDTAPAVDAQRRPGGAYR